MAEHKEESAMEKTSEKLHGLGGSSSSSDSDDEKSSSSAAAAMKVKIYRLFGREKPVHSVLGGGKRKSRARKLLLSFSTRVLVGFVPV